jgi:hypothetical protein
MRIWILSVAILLVLVALAVLPAYVPTLGLLPRPLIGTREPARR